MLKIHTPKPFLSIALLLFCLTLLPLPASAQWTEIEPGYEYRQFNLSGPVEAFVIRMFYNDATARQTRAIDSAIAQGQFHKTGLPNGGREIPSAMAARYDDVINNYYQNWGSRNDVIACINGDYWEREYYPGGPYTGRPQGGQIVSGWFARRFTEWGGGSGFFWTVWGYPYLGGDVVNGGGAARQKVIFSDDSDINITGVNVERGSGDLILYTPQWDSNTHTDNAGVEVLIKMSRPALVLPPPAKADGTIVEIRNGAGSTDVPFDHVVLSSNGSSEATLLSKCVAGETISLQMNMLDYGLTSRTPPLPAPDWTKAYGSVGVDREVVVTGQVTDNMPSPDTTRDPRTAVAFNDDYFYFIVVDGRRTGSIGMTFGEVGNFCVNSLTATHAATLDGGGSSALWIKGLGIVNQPSDGTQRATTNGVLMVSVQPANQTTTFSSGEAVTTNAATSLRFGPGDNYDVVTPLNSGQAGTIVAHDMLGIEATGKNWWYVDFAGATGWIPQSALVGGIDEWRSY